MTEIRCNFPIYVIDCFKIIGAIFRIYNVQYPSKVKNTLGIVHFGLILCIYYCIPCPSHPPHNFFPACEYTSLGFIKITNVNDDCVINLTTDINIYKKKKKDKFCDIFTCIYVYGIS